MQRDQNHPAAQEQEALQWHTSSLFEPEADPIVHVKRAKQRLTSSKKGGPFKTNSAKFDAVDHGLDGVLKLLPTAITGDAVQDGKSQRKLSVAYGTLLHACKEYNTKLNSNGDKVRRKAFWQKGRQRQSIVDDIETMVKNDLDGLMSYYDKMPGLPADERAKTIQDALRIARTSTLKLKGTWGNQKHVGGAISDLAEVNAGEFEGTNRSGFFKKGESYEVKDPQQKALDVLTSLSEKLKIPADDYNFIYNHIMKAKGAEVVGYVSALSTSRNPEYANRYNGSKQYHEFVDALYKACKGQDTMKDYMKDMIQIDPNEKKVDLSKRNVASARLANLLGAGNLIAQSELATMEDADGKKINGFLMQKAEGDEAVKVAESVGNTEYAKKMEQRPNDKVDSLDALEKMVTGGFQKSLADLQVLDNLFGQVDRHTGNYLVQQKGGKLTGLTGIDNDFGFGMARIGVGKNNVTGREEAKSKNQFLHYAADREGNLTIPHMSEGLANKILKLTKPQIEYVMADLLEPSAIEGLWGRIAHMQTAIRAEKEKPDSNRLLKDDQWNEKTLQDFKTHGNNYMADFLNQGQNLGERHESYLLNRKTVAASNAWDKAIKEGQMSTEDKATAFISKVLEQKVVDYWVKSGQLAEWVGTGKGIPFNQALPCLINTGIKATTASWGKLKNLYPQFFKEFA